MVRPGLPPATEGPDRMGPASVCLENGRGERSQPSGADLFVAMTWSLPVKLVGLRRALGVVR